MEGNVRAPEPRPSRSLPRGWDGLASPSVPTPHRGPDSRSTAAPRPGHGGWPRAAPLGPAVRLPPSDTVGSTEGWPGRAASSPLINYPNLETESPLSQGWGFRTRPACLLPPRPHPALLPGVAAMAPTATSSPLPGTPICQLPAQVGKLRLLPKAGTRGSLGVEAPGGTTDVSPCWAGEEAGAGHSRSPGAPARPAPGQPSWFQIFPTGSEREASDPRIPG